MTGPSDHGPSRHAAPSNASAIVFAYHNVGVRCLKVLLDGGVDVRLVVTHADNPAEAIWFDSVVAVAAEAGLRCIAPADANAAEIVAECARAAPDFLFSFYYRHMLKAPLLDVPTRGAYNMHGSLLPSYRGRAPVNWAVLNGERSTGASLHAMDIKPDQGPLIDQCAVPILRDDTARQVFDKVTLAAEIVMARALPLLIDGSATRTPQDLSRGGYFGGRNAEDGRIVSSMSARRIHDLVRAVAPPEYPGAFFDTRAGRVLIVRTRPGPAEAAESAEAEPQSAHSAPALLARDHTLWLRASDGRSLRVLAASLAGEPLDAAAFEARFGTATLTALTAVITAA